MKYKILVVGTDKELNNRIYSQMDHENVDGIKKMENTLMHSIRLLTKSNLVVTLKDWNGSAEAQKIVDVARILDIPVVPLANFQHYVQQLND